jgi:hypothetical protein
MWIRPVRPLSGGLQWRLGSHFPSIRRSEATLRRRIVDKDARKNYAKHLHVLDHLFEGTEMEHPYGKELRQVEAGEPVVVQGWKFGYAADWSHYCLESDGRITPVEAIHVDESAKVLTVENWRRPDGSLVRSGANNPT